MVYDAVSGNSYVAVALARDSCTRRRRGVEGLLRATPIASPSQVDGTACAGPLPLVELRHCSRALCDFVTNRILQALQKVGILCSASAALISAIEVEASSDHGSACMRTYNHNARIRVQYGAAGNVVVREPAGNVVVREPAEHIL